MHSTCCRNSPPQMVLLTGANAVYMWALQLYKIPTNCINPGDCKATAQSMERQKTHNNNRKNYLKHDGLISLCEHAQLCCSWYSNVKLGADPFQGVVNSTQLMRSPFFAHYTQVVVEPFGLAPRLFTQFFLRNLGDACRKSVHSFWQLTLNYTCRGFPRFFFTFFPRTRRALFYIIKHGSVT